MVPTNVFEACEDASKIYCHIGEQDFQSETAYTCYVARAKLYVVPSRHSNDSLWQSDLLPTVPIETISLLVAWQPLVHKPIWTEFVLSTFCRLGDKPIIPQVSSNPNYPSKHYIFLSMHSPKSYWMLQQHHLFVGDMALSFGAKYASRRHLLLDWSLEMGCPHLTDRFPWRGYHHSKYYRSSLCSRDEHIGEENPHQSSDGWASTDRPIYYAEGGQESGCAPRF